MPKLPFPVRLGRNITAARERLEISLRELARRADVSPSVLSLYEAGQREPTASRLFRLADALGVKVDELR
jgi:transcriptional regulator with XRE-family HTH domain